MANSRLKRDTVYRWYLASPLAFADWRNPTVAELNANPDNDPSGLIFNISCALNQEGSQFDLDEPETDESLTFCQEPGSPETMSRSATVVFQFEEARTRWMDGTSTDAADGFNTANLTKSLLMWRGVEYFAIFSVGAEYDEPFAVGDQIKMAEIATDYAIPDVSTGSMINHTQTTASRSRLLWNYEIAA